MGTAATAATAAASDVGTCKTSCGMFGFPSAVAPALGCQSKADAAAFCGASGDFWCERLDRCSADCADCYHHDPASTTQRAWTLADGATNTCRMQDGHTCGFDETGMPESYCPLTNKCVQGGTACQYECFDNSTRSPEHLDESRLCIDASPQTCAHHDMYYCANKNDCVNECGAECGDAFDHAYDYRVDVFGAMPDGFMMPVGRKCGDKSEALATCARSGTGQKLCDEHNGGGFHCVSSCDDCWLQAQAEHIDGSTATGGMTAASVAAFATDACSGNRGDDRVQYPADADGDSVCDVTAVECARVGGVRGSHALVLCASANKCVHSCSHECKEGGLVYRDRTINECVNNETVSYAYFDEYLVGLE
jgi:hypothetical protein